MFILRQVFENGEITNVYLGERYSLIRKKELPELFDIALNNTDSHPDSKDIYAVLLYDDGEKQKNYPLYMGFHYYIMIENGKTFEHVKE